jgi:hypothetical protein
LMVRGGLGRCLIVISRKELKLGQRKDILLKQFNNLGRKSYEYE